MKRSTTLTFLLLGLLALLTLAGPAAPVRAASYVVSSTNDNGPGSLRQAILEANAAAGTDTITFGVGGIIVLESTLSITDPDGLTIDGVGQDITISGDNEVRVMFVDSGAELTVANLTVANGSSADAGGGIDNRGVLTVSNSTFSGNSADDEVGGGIANAGTLTVTNSTFSGNSATGLGGSGIGNVGTLTVTNSTFSSNSTTGLGGGIANFFATVTVTNSTFSGNSADGLGGGIYSVGTVTVTNSTFSGNSADGLGGGIFFSGGTATLKNTIVANSPSGGNCSGPIGDGGGNLSNDGTCPFTGTSMNNTDPMLGPLQDNGGPTETMALLLGSPAVDAAVDCPPPATGQRGVTRPQGAGCDIGAFELMPQEAIANLQADVQALVDGGSLNKGQGNALNSKLDKAIKKLDQGQPQAAVNNLNAFINQVNAFINSGVLSEVEGEPLVDEANRIIAVIEADL